MTPIGTKLPRRNFLHLLAAAGALPNASLPGLTRQFHPLRKKLLRRGTPGGECATLGSVICWWYAIVSKPARDHLLVGCRIPNGR